jgi:exopolysaccharide production protein ExoZ
MISPRSPKIFQSLQAGRGLAALLVVLYHAGSAVFPSEKYWHAQTFRGIFDFGYSGVDFFFALSGFIILHMHSSDIARPQRLWNYLRRRITRLYPVYWLIFIPAAILIRPPIAEVFQSAVLIGFTDEPTVLTVAWTLFHEIIFYIVFGLWILSRKVGLFMSAIWLFSIILCYALKLEGNYLVQPINLTFGMGIAAWWISNHGRMSNPFLWAIAGMIAYIVTAVSCNAQQFASTVVYHLVFGFTSAVAIAGFATIERTRQWKLPGAVMLLGSASYSIYLTHYPVLVLLAKVAVATGLRNIVPVPAAFVAILFATIGIGIAFHVVVERRLLRWIGTMTGPAMRAST